MEREPEDNKNGTTLSTYYWKKRREGLEPVVKYSLVRKNIPTFNPATKSCRLCLAEKLCILFNPGLSTLNNRKEVFASCRHKRQTLIGKIPRRTGKRTGGTKS